MNKNFKSAVRQWALFVTSTVVAFAILVKTDVVSHLAYLVEKGRIQALREAMPGAEDLEQWNGRARHVANVVAPAVVQIMTERTYDLSASAKGDALEELLGLDADRGEGPADSNGPPRFRELDELHLRDRELVLPEGYGSGFIVDADAGHIVTNHHVIENADVVKIFLADGRRYEAEVLGSDPKTDLAVLRIEADRLHELKVVDSGGVEVGDDVMAVGNPFGLDGTFSRGIISAKGRSSVEIHGIEYKDFFQTDAVINPGNSGGPLVNMRGEVIAINTAIATDSGHYDGVGFAIPSRRILQLLPVLARGDHVERGFLGVSVRSVTDTPQAAREALGWDRYDGVVVGGTLPDSPAQRAGLQSGDIIHRIDGRRIGETADLLETIADTRPGTRVTLHVWRDKSDITIEAEIARQPEDFSTRSRPSE